MNKGNDQEKKKRKTTENGNLSLEGHSNTERVKQRACMVQMERQKMNSTKTENSDWKLSVIVVTYYFIYQLMCAVKMLLTIKGNRHITKLALHS